MAYFQITGKVEEADENSYTIQSTGEVVTNIHLYLVVPGMRDRVTCELPAEEAPKVDILERWELEESWVVVGADGMGALTFELRNARAGEKPVGALVVFPGGRGARGDGGRAQGAAAGEEGAEDQGQATARSPCR